MKHGVLIFLLFQQIANGFPEFIRHGYTNCMTCHVSNQGGGALTTYGRELSKEVLSYASIKGEQHYGHGVLDPELLPKWISALGGDFRAVQVHRENSRVVEGRFIPMQADIESGVKMSSVLMQGTVGAVEHKKKVKADVRKIYVQSEIGVNHFLKLGIYPVIFGLNIPEHISYIKSELQLLPKNEKFQAEYQWIDSHWNIFAGIMQSSLKRYELDQKSGGFLQVSYAPNNHLKLGIGQMNRADFEEKENIYNLWGIWGKHKFYVLSEVDLKVNTKSDEEKSLKSGFSYSKIGYEVVQGFHTLGLYESAQTDLFQLKTRRDSLGLGLAYYPRPHFEITGVWNKVYSRIPSKEWGDFAWLQLHYYL